MEMLGWIIVTAFAEIVLFSILGFFLFRGSSSINFLNMDEYIRHSKRQTLLCREIHIIEAVTVGATSGLIACSFTGATVIPLLIMFGILEGVWLSLTFIVRPQNELNYTIMPHLFAGLGVGIAAGIGASIFFGITVLPLIVALIAFWVAWLLLMPM